MVVEIVKGYVALANSVARIPQERASSLLTGVVDVSGRAATVIAPVVQQAQQVGTGAIGLGARRGAQAAGAVRSMAEDVIRSTDRALSTLEDVLLSLIAPRSSRAPSAPAHRFEDVPPLATVPARRLSRPSKPASAPAAEAVPEARAATAAAVDEGPQPSAAAAPVEDPASSAEGNTPSSPDAAPVGADLDGDEPDSVDHVGGEPDGVDHVGGEPDGVDHVGGEPDGVDHVGADPDGADLDGASSTDRP